MDTFAIYNIVSYAADSDQIKKMGTNKFLVIRDVVLVVILLLASAVATRELPHFQNCFPSKFDFLFMYIAT